MAFPAASQLHSSHAPSEHARRLFQAARVGGPRTLAQATNLVSRLIFDSNDSPSPTALAHVTDFSPDEARFGPVAPVDESTSPEDTYERPTVDSALVADLEAALAKLHGLHETYLVTRRRAYEDRQKIGLGVAAHVGGRWRSRRKIAAVNDALRPFFPDRLQWAAPANSPVADEARAVGVPLRRHS